MNEGVFQGFIDMNQEHEEVTVIILSYNSSWDKLKLTIDSIICQEDVNFSLIISDDGSKEMCFSKVYEYLTSRHFVKFNIIESKLNQGTVINAINGLKNARGTYSKLIGPGDTLLHKRVLREWLDFIGGAPWSFSEAMCVNEDGKKITVKAHPQNVSIYTNADYKTQQWQYVVLNDIPIGATVIGRTDLQLQYCQKLRNAGVIYAEDNIWRLMMFDGIIGKYCPMQNISYEVGSGISTNHSKIWEERLCEDWRKTNVLMIPQNIYQKEMVNALNKKGFLARLFIKKQLLHWLRTKIKARKTYASN